MDFDSSSKFIASLAKFLQSLCNGYVEFDKGVEVIGHIYLSVDSETGKKIDYVLNEKVCKNDNSVTFISNSFHAQPAEKPKPLPKKSDVEKRNDDSVVIDESGQAVPSSTNVGTMGAIPMRGNQDGSYSPGSKRPRSPLHRKGGMGRGSDSPVLKPGMSPRFDVGGPSKMARSDIPYASAHSVNSSEDYDGGGYQDDDDGYPSNFLNQDDQSSHDIDQKPIIDPDISIVKEEHMASQQTHPNVPSTYSQHSGPGRGKPSSAPYAMMMHQTPSASLGPHTPDTYSGSSLEGADPSTPFSLVSVNQGGCAFKFRTQRTIVRRRRLAETNEMYSLTQREEMGRYALTYGASAASRHFSNVYGKRIPRSSVQNFINSIRKNPD